MIGTCLRQNDGPRGSLQERFFVAAQVADCARSLKIPDHNSKRLAVAMLALSQAHHGNIVCRIDGEMEASNALDGEDLAAKKTLDRLFNKIGALNRNTFRRLEPDTWSAFPAGVRLSMKSAVKWIIVFGLTL